MGTLRKMGAFLGLVPDDQRYSADVEGDDLGYQASEYDYADGADRYAEAGDGSYGTDSYPADSYAGNSYGADSYPADSFPADSYPAASYDADAHGEAHGAVAHGGGYGADARADNYGAAGYGTGEFGDDGQPGGFQATDPGYGNQPDHEPAYAGASAAAAPAMRAGGAKKARGGTRGGSRGRQDDTDFHTQGALAVQPQQLQPEAAAEPATGKPATVKLTGFGDARQVGETYRDGQAVILDMTDLTDTETRRMVDFAAGLAFAVHGSIDKVTTKVFMLHQPTGDPAN